VSSIEGVFSQQNVFYQTGVQVPLVQPNDDVTHVYDDVTYVYDDVTYVYDDVTHVYDDVT
jgi:hypothetical protein